MPPCAGGSPIGGRGDDYIGGVDGSRLQSTSWTGVRTVTSPDRRLRLESAVDPCVNGEVPAHKGFPDTEPLRGNAKSG